MQIHTTLRHYARIVRQRMVFILLGIVFCASTTGLISLCIPPAYQAKALLKVNYPAATSNNDAYNAQAQAVDYALLVTSPEVLRAAVPRLPGVTMSELQQAISDAPIENTQIIEIRAQAEEAGLAADMANTVATLFIQLQAKNETDRLQNSATMLTQRIVTTRFDLDAAQQYLNVLQNDHAAPASIAQQRSLVDTDQANYGLLLTDYSQLQVQKLQMATLLSIVQTAQPPDKPNSPQVLANVLLAAAMSSLLMILLTLLLDWFDTTLKTDEDVLNLTGLIPLGCIPAGSPAEEVELLDLGTTSSVSVHEALHTVGVHVRAQLKGQRLLLVSGVRTKAGATTVAVHLAISLAQSGMRVLLLDANQRRPLLHEVFRGPNTNGLSNRLADIRRFQEQPMLYPGSWLQHWRTPITNLWVIPTGPPFVQPAATSIQELQQLKEWLLGERKMPDDGSILSLIDLIICDTAPPDEGGDTYELSTIADGIVLVIEAGKEQKETLYNIQALQLQAPILGVVINRQKAGQTPYYYTHSQNTVHAMATHTVSDSVKGQMLQEQRLTIHNRPAHEQQTVSEVPSVRFAATPSVGPRKIAERPTALTSMPNPGAPLTSTGRKLGQIDRLIPKTPILFPLRSTAEDSKDVSQPAGNVLLAKAEMPSLFPLRKGRTTITTDPLPEAIQNVETELQVVSVAQESKTQFKTRPGKRA